MRAIKPFSRARKIKNKSAAVAQYNSDISRRDCEILSRDRLVVNYLANTLTNRYDKFIV